MEKKTYTEISQPYDSKAQAHYKLQSIRDHFNEAAGWHEIDGYVEQLPNGKWQAVRVHEKHWN